MIETLPKPDMKDTEPYQAKFEKRFVQEGGGRYPAWVYPVRKAGMARFTELGFPTLKQEDWRFTNVAPIVKLPFKPLLDPARVTLTADRLKGFPFLGIPSSRLVFVDGHFAPELSVLLPQPEGVVLGSLAAALASGSPVVQQHLAQPTRREDNAFAALNTAFFADGAFIYVPAGRQIEAPVHLVFIATSPEAGAATHSRNLIIAEKSSRLTLLESYVSAVDASYVTNSVNELVIGENAVVEHLKFQDESRSAFHVATLQMSLGRSCNFISHSIAAGAKLSRNSIRTFLGGEGIECVLNGLYLTKGDQLADHHMVVEHAQPHCSSHEYYNGILDDRSKGVFHGRILVRPEAQKTDAKQTNKNLLLSDNATVDTKPQLEIYADDVKCTHGATVGQLNEESIFYLRARGIGLPTARRMLIHAFAGEIIARVRCEPAREELDRLVWDALEQNPHIAAAPVTSQPQPPAQP